MHETSAEPRRRIGVTEAIEAAAAAGYDFATGVPCSYLSALIDGCVADPRLNYLGAASEGEAVCLAAGAWLAGRRPLLLIQNSGLGNAVNPLTSLNVPFRIPLTCLIGWRGQAGNEDEPQHRLMGEISPSLLRLLGADLRGIPEEPDAFAAEISAAARISETGRRVIAYLVSKGTFAAGAIRPGPTVEVREEGKHFKLAAGTRETTRADILSAFLESADETVFAVASTGYCGRELFTLGDREQNFYQVGSMGGAAAIGLGLAISTSARIVVFDGDGAALMKLGSLATIGAAGAERLVHVILDNSVHESTGGQATVSPSVSFAEVALACGYRWGVTCDTPESFLSALGMNELGPGLIHVLIKPGAMAALGRPTISPETVASRFRDALVPHRLRREAS